MSDKNVTFIEDGVQRKLEEQQDLLALIIEDGVQRKLEELQGLLELMMVEKGLKEEYCQLVAVKNAFHQFDSTVASITVQDTWLHESAKHLRLAAMQEIIWHKDRLDSGEDGLTEDTSLILRATIPESDELLKASQSGLLHDIDLTGRTGHGVDAVARLFSFSLEKVVEQPAVFGFGDLEDDQVVEVPATLNELLDSQTILDDFISLIAENLGNMMRKKAAEICM